MLLCGRLTRQRRIAKCLVLYALLPRACRYAHIWDIEGAVPADQGAKRVLYEISKSTMERSGTFVNCEDGKLIPW